MPKPKPDNITRHEFVLGRAERELLRDVQMSYSFSRIISPFTNLSAPGAILLGSSALLLIDYILDSIGLDPDWREIIADMTPEQVSDWFETQNLVLRGIGAIIGGLLFSYPGAIIGGAVGSGIAEAGEAAFEAADDAGVLPNWASPTGDETQEQKAASAFWLGLLQMRATLGIVAATTTD